MLAFNDLVRRIEQQPDVQTIRKTLSRLEEQMKNEVSAENWELLLQWEEQWARYAHVVARNVFPLAYQQGWLSKHQGGQQIQTMIECEDECMICTGVALTSRLALVWMHHEHHLILCGIEPIPHSNVYRIKKSSDDLLTDQDFLFPSIVNDLQKLTFAQFAEKYEMLLMQALLPA